MHGYLTMVQFIADNSEILTDWIIALSMAFGVAVLTALGIIFLILYSRGNNEKNYTFTIDGPRGEYHLGRVWVNKQSGSGESGNDQS